MGWNHRILAHKDGDEIYFQIHEVYYDKDGKPDSYTTNGVSVGAESLEGIKWVLGKMKECANKPILLADGFPNQYNVMPSSCLFNGQRRAVIKETESFYFFAVGNRFKWNYAEKHLCTDLEYLNQA